MFCLSSELGNVKIAVNLGIHDNPKRQGVGTIDLTVCFEIFSRFRAIRSAPKILGEVGTPKDHNSFLARTKNWFLVWD
jgi:hypothetical protein